MRLCPYFQSGAIGGGVSWRCRGGGGQGVSGQSAPSWFIGCLLSGFYCGRPGRDLGGDTAPLNGALTDKVLTWPLVYSIVYY